MSEMEKNEIEKLLKDNPHLVKYVQEIENKIGRPTFYNKVPREIKSLEFPNLIYPTKGVVFIHVFKTKDMESAEYHAIEPDLNEVTKIKRDHILELMYERAHFKANVKSQDDLKKAIKERIDELIVLDEKSEGKLPKIKAEKLKLVHRKG